MKKISNTKKICDGLKLLSVVALTSFLTIQFFAPSPSEAQAKNLKSKSAYERVLEKQTLRCSYVPYAPANIIDPNTGEMSGIFYEVAEAIGRQLDIKIEWVEESTWSTFMEGIRSGRADAFCGAAFGFAAELKYGELVGPVYYSPITLWVRKKDTRFDNNPSALNDEKITVVGEDGSIAVKLAPDIFPKAKLAGLPDNAPYSMKLDNVAHNKADATLVETSVGLDYIANNPNTLKNATPNAPVTVYPNMFVVAKGEFELQSMIQGAMNILHNNGTIERIITKYEKHAGSILRVNKPYEL